MERFDFTVVRFSKETLDKAEQLSSSSCVYPAEDIIRIAAWLGLKFMKVDKIQDLLIMEFREREGVELFTPEDILLAVGNLKEDKQSEGL